MNLTQVTVTNLSTGNGVADATAKPIIATGVAKKSYKGTTLHCNTGAIFVGGYNVTTENGFELPAGRELLVPIEDPSKIYVVGSGTYSWLSV